MTLAEVIAEMELALVALSQRAEQLEQDCDKLDSPSPAYDSAYRSLVYTEGKIDVLKISLSKLKGVTSL